MATLEAPNRPVMVVIVGMTGAGKTTFTSLASDAVLKIRHGLDPCTQDPQAIEFILDGRKVILIDTPGFDDSKRNDLEILEDIAIWLSREGLTKDHPVDGLILLHPITDFTNPEEQLQRSMERKRTLLIQSILGQDAYERVVIATTMWGIFDPGQMASVVDRIRFRAKRGVWKDLCAGGATITRHYNDKESAHRIIRKIIDRSNNAKRVETLLQKELANNSTGRFTDTTLGKELKRSLEEDIDRTLAEIVHHRRDRPPKEYRKSQDPGEQREWREWEEENQNLSRDLEKQQRQLRKLNSFSFRMLSFFYRIFR